MFTLKSKADNVKNTNEGKPVNRNIKKLENLDYWFTLSRVAALSSMNKAAEELNIDVSSVSNKIRVLEKALGYELLERQSHSSFLTAQGESVLKTIFPIVEDFTYTLTQLCQEDKETRQTIKVNVSNGLLELVIGWIKLFCQLYPDVDFELTDNKSEDLGHQLGFDIAVFANFSQRPPGECRDLGVAPTYMAASKEYLSTHPVRSPEDLKRCRIISCYNWNCGQRFLYGPHGTKNIPLSWGGFFGLDNSTSLLCAVKKGLGIGWGIPVYMCQKDLNNGALVRLFEPYESAGLHFYMAVGSHRFTGIRKEFLDFFLSSWKREFQAYKTHAPCYALR